MTPSPRHCDFVTLARGSDSALHKQLNRNRWPMPLRLYMYRMRGMCARSMISAPSTTNSLQQRDPTRSRERRERCDILHVIGMLSSLGEQKIGRIKSDIRNRGIKWKVINERSAAKVGGLSGVGAPPEPETLGGTSAKRLLLSTTTAKLPAGASRRPASRRCVPPVECVGG